MSHPPEAWVGIGAATTPVFSRDGNTIWHLRGGGLPQVWAMHRDGGDARAITAHGEKTWKLSRSPADDRLLWAVDAGGDERQQLYLREADGSVRTLTDAPAVIHEFGCWAPDGNSIAFAANDRDPNYFDIVVMHLASGERRRLLEGRHILTVPAWSPAARPGGPTLVVHEDVSTSDQRLYLLEVATGAVAPVPHPAPTRYASVRWESDRGGIAGADRRRRERLHAALPDRPRDRHGNADLCRRGRDVEAWSLSPDGTLLATVENDRGASRLRVGPIGGDRPEIGRLPLASLPTSPGHRTTTLAFSLTGPTEPGGIWLCEAATGRCARAGDPTRGRKPASTPPPSSRPGWSSGRLRRPRHRRLLRHPARPPRPAGGWPAVVWVHGGPAAQTRANFRPDIQMLLDHGFAILMPNLRGSTGYGRAFMEADDVGRRPDYLRDLEAAHAFLAARPEIDAARIGIMGQSYGGWAVLAAMTLQPALWRAGCDYYGIADFATLLEHTSPWRRDHRAREYGFPETDDALFDRISPLRHVGNVTAPLLVLHADRDPRVPMNEFELFVRAMREHGKPVSYERITWAGHGFNAAAHRRLVWSAVARHFETHLR